jgi:hypothetical protein
MIEVKDLKKSFEAIVDRTGVSNRVASWRQSGYSHRQAGRIHDLA